MLSPSQLARARAHTYTLLSNLFLYGLTPATLPAVQAIPELAAALPDPFDADQAAAEHHDLFGFNIFPYAGIFLDTTGLLSGPVAGQVAAAYRRMAFAVQDETADHLGHELAFLAFLSQGEAEAQGGPEAERWQRAAAQFLNDHLLCWLPPLVQAVRQQGRTFYTALVNLALELLLDHLAGLPEAAGCQLPQPPSLALDDEKTGLREIADFLLTPVYSGLFMGRADIGRLARGLNIPRGFGSRQQMLVNLFRTAAQYDHFDDLLAALQAQAAQWQAGYEALAPVYAAPWLARLAGTRAMLAAVQARG